MTVFPIKTNEKNTTISASFGKSKYFAFYDGVEVKIVENPTSDGMALISWLAKSGVTGIIIKEIGSNPFKAAKQNNFKIYFCDDTNLTIDDVIKKLDTNNFEVLEEEQIKTVINKQQKKDSHSDKNTKILVFPTDENIGFKSKLGAHFGKAKFYTIVTLKKDELLDVVSIKNPGESDGGCIDAISSIISFSPNALIVNEIASSPARGLLDAGLEIYSDIESPTIEESVKKYLNKTLILLEDNN